MSAKKIFLILPVAILLGACSDSGSDSESGSQSQLRNEGATMMNPEQTKADVIAALNSAHDAYARRDVNALLAHFAPAPDVVMIGTGADERRVGLNEIKAQAERDWAQTEASSIQLGWHSVTASKDGSTAWVAADGKFNVRAEGQEMTVPARVTAVLENHGGKWLVAQAHYSTPMAGQAEGESFPDASGQ